MYPALQQTTGEKCGLEKGDCGWMPTIPRVVPSKSPSVRRGAGIGAFHCRFKRRSPSAGVRITKHPESNRQNYTEFELEQELNADHTAEPQ